MSSKVTRESMVVRKGGRAISATETPEQLGKLQSYGSPAYSVTRDTDGGKWSAIWIRFSEVTPDLHTHMTGLGWVYNDRRSAYKHTDDAQGRTDMTTLLGSSTTPSTGSAKGSGKGKGKGKDTQAATPEQAPTPTDAPKTTTPAVKADLTKTPEQRVKAYTHEELISQLEYYSYMAHLCAVELNLRK